jgi:selenocysteine lyase/cysteine desulfurase
MGAAVDGLGCNDGVCISPHKLIGGPGTPGILVARRDLFTNRVPDVPGGGSVASVNSSEQDDHVDIEEREEAGTSAIVGSIRAGLVSQLK